MVAKVFLGINRLFSGLVFIIPFNLLIKKCYEFLYLLMHNFI